MAEQRRPNPDEKMPEHKQTSSGDQSGQGRQRRDDGDVFPQKRDTDQMGTHGGPAKHAPTTER